MKHLYVMMAVMFPFLASAQDTVYARKMLNGLCNPAFAGRGYVHKGDKKAAVFIASEFERLGLQKVNGKRFQDFRMSVNTISETEVIYNGVTLRPGIDYLIHPSSPSCDYEGISVFLSSETLSKGNQTVNLQFDGKAVVADTFTPAYNKEAGQALKRISVSPGTKLLIKLSSQKLVWGSSPYEAPVCVVTLNEKVFKRGENAHFKVRIRNRFYRHYKTANVLGMLPGTGHTDSAIYITAHYDHLGKMGKDAVFLGANDNASGIAMLLNLAAWYKENPQPYHMVFIAFSGEENGLVGSKHYTEHPVLSLQNIRFLINLDLMANGSEGLMAVNGSILAKDFKALQHLNTQKAYLPDIKARGKAANSDHFWFTEKGVPAFFFYLMGPYPHYHDVHDKPEMVPFSNFGNAFLLFRDFIGYLQISRPD